MLKVNKWISFSLLGVMTMFAGLPANAGYYKTIYVNDPQPATTIIVNQPVQEKVIVQEKYVEPVEYSSGAAAALGITALVGGIILGVASHNHHKKIHKHSQPSHSGGKGRGKPNNHKHKR